MIANYHTHTPRCRHAEGTEEEYVRTAIDAGFRILGFSDHTPQWFPGDYYSHMRMYPDELTGYCEAVRAVQRANQDSLQIHLGLEVEYYPALFQQMLEQARDNGVEYFLLGQHWPGNEMDEPYCGRATEDESRLERYCNQVMDAMNTGLFTYLAHPDLLNFTGDDRIYRRHMTRLCREARSCDVPLEINLLGLDTGRNYPNPEFWKIAAEEGCRCIIGFDAHQPQGLTNMAAYQRALDMVTGYGLELLETVSLRPIG